MRRLKKICTMSNTQPSPESKPCGGGCGDWTKTLEDLSARARDFARKEPAQAVGLALLAGLVLTVLPVGRVAGGLVRLAFALARPVLLIVGAVKLCEEFEKRNRP